MKERDYIIVSSLTRLRDAYSILRDVVPRNAAGPMKIAQDRADDEYQHIMECLGVWVARLERAVDPTAPDKEPWLRDWPGDKLGTSFPPAAGGKDR